MGWPLRMFQEEGDYFVTSRCIQGRLLLRPSAEVNEVANLSKKVGNPVVQLDEALEQTGKRGPGG
ncbi:hypothetical protein ACN28S_55895 [Cystobacter fuscus]